MSNERIEQKIHETNTDQDTLLGHLNKLQQLKTEGKLSEREFILEKEKLLRN